MTCDEQGEELGREGCCCREGGTRIFRALGGAAGGCQKVASSAVQRGAGARPAPTAACSWSWEHPKTPESQAGFIQHLCSERGGRSSPFPCRSH